MMGSRAGEATDAAVWLDRNPGPVDRDLSAASDSELAEALSLRELAALDEAFRRHATQVARTVRKIAGGYHVDDVVQEVFLRLWRAPERFRPERGSLATYLTLLAHNRAIDVMRSDASWQRRNVRHGGTWASADDVEETMIARVSASELWKALRALPMTERVAIELAFFGGYSYRQVAEQLGEPEGTIKSRIRAGLRRLEAALRGMRAAEL